jgi:hypothetical protein
MTELCASSVVEHEYDLRFVLEKKHHPRKRAHLAPLTELEASLRENRETDPTTKTAKGKLPTAKTM